MALHIYKSYSARPCVKTFRLIGSIDECPCLCAEHCVVCTLSMFSATLFILRWWRKKNEICKRFLFYFLLVCWCYSRHYAITRKPIGSPIPCECFTQKHCFLSSHQTLLFADFLIPSWISQSSEWKIDWQCFSPFTFYPYNSDFVSEPINIEWVNQCYLNISFIMHVSIRKQALQTLFSYFD